MGECLVARRSGNGQASLVFLGQVTLSQSITTMYIYTNTLTWAAAKPGNFFVLKSGTAYLGFGYCETEGKIKTVTANSNFAKPRVADWDVTYDLYSVDISKVK